MDSAVYRLIGATTALLLFELNPMALALPADDGISRWCALGAAAAGQFFITMSIVDTWSFFMRAIVLAGVWSLFLWVHVPTALCVLLGMVPWVIYNRRPAAALGPFAPILFLGTVLYSAIWSLCWALARQWSMMQSPFSVFSALGGVLRLGLMSLVRIQDASTIADRVAHVAGWLSPFFLLLGLWVSGLGVRHMLKERRASTGDLAAVVSLVFLGAILLDVGQRPSARPLGMASSW